MHRSIPTLALLAALLPASPDAQATPKPDSLALARQFTLWFYAGEIDSLVAHHPAESRADTAVRQDLRRNIAMLALRAGMETTVLEEKFVMRNGRPQYWRSAKFSGMDEPILLRWVINPQGEIIGIGLGLLSQAPPIDPPR